jgi:hypothetical protein
MLSPGSMVYGIHPAGVAGQSGLTGSSMIGGCSPSIGGSGVGVIITGRTVGVGTARVRLQAITVKTINHFQQRRFENI